MPQVYLFHAGQVVLLPQDRIVERLVRLLDLPMKTEVHEGISMW